MQTENLIGADKVMDVRSIPCSVKHGLIIKTWLELPVGDHFILFNDHDPVPLSVVSSTEGDSIFPALPGVMISVSFAACILTPSAISYTPSTRRSN